MTIECQQRGMVMIFILNTVTGKKAIDAYALL